MVTDEVKEIFETQTTNITVRDNHAGGLELISTSGQLDHLGVEFVRRVGGMILEEGYYISGMRQHLDKERPRIEIWFDDVNQRLGENTEDVVGSITIDASDDEAISLLRQIVEDLGKRVVVDTVYDDGSINFIIEG